jgi:hypothetical protein
MATDDARRVPCFLLHHKHAARDCRTAFAAWRGYASALRHESATASCLFGGHEIWWQVEATSEPAALALLPPWLAARATATRVAPIETP